MRLTTLAFATLVLVAAGARAATVDIPFHREVLDNGLTVIVHEDRKAPVVAVNLWYHVGSKNETPGRTGFAHLFEHLMFQGTENFRGEFLGMLESLGASDFNGTTWLDRTNYFATVQKNALDSLLWVESDRMGHFLGAVTQAVLDEQRGVVKNEKRQRQNQPYGEVWEIIQRNVFPPDHPYSWETIGSMEDLDAASLEDVRTWFRTWYGPNNAVLVIAGDVDTAEVVGKVKHYFGDIPASPPTSRPETWIPRHATTRRMSMQDNVPQPRLFMAWAGPQWGSTDAHHLGIAAAILAGDKNSRLYQRLVYRDRLATDIELDFQPFEISGFVSFEASPQPGVDLRRIEEVFREEVAAFARKGPTARELERIRAQARTGFLRSIERIGGGAGKAATLAESQVYGGRPDAWKDEMAALESARPEDLRRTVAEWLTDGYFALDVQPVPAFAASDKGADRKGGLPEPGAAPAAPFPAVERAELPNGLRIVLAPRAGSGLVDLQLIVEGGYSTDPADRGGLATAAMAMLDEGTARRDALAISDELAMLGAGIGAGAQLDTATVSLSTPRDVLAKSLDVFADVVLNPAFPEEELGRQRSLMLAALQQERNRPTSMGLRVLPQLIYGAGHPYARPLTGTGTEASIRAMTRAELAAFHGTWFRANQATLVAAGDTSMAELKPLVEKLFGGWARGDARRPQPGAPAAAAAAGAFYLLDRPGAEQSVVFAAQTVPGRSSADDLAMQLMNNALGGQASARLNMNLREDKHWSYGAFTVITDTRADRPLFAYAPVQTDRTAESVAEIRREFADIVRARQVSADELAHVKRSEILALPGRWETNAAVVGALAESVRYGLPDDYWPRYGERLGAVALDDVQRVAASELRPDGLVWVVIGDRAKIEPALRKAGFTDIRTLDADGKAP